MKKGSHGSGFAAAHWTREQQSGIPERYLHFSMGAGAGGEGEAGNTGACVVEGRDDTMIAGRPSRDNPFRSR